MTNIPGRSRTRLRRTIPIRTPALSASCARGRRLHELRRGKPSLPDVPGRSRTFTASFGDWSADLLHHRDDSGPWTMDHGPRRPDTVRALRIGRTGIAPVLSWLRTRCVRCLHQRPRKRESERVKKPEALRAEARSRGESDEVPPKPEEPMPRAGTSELREQTSSCTSTAKADAPGRIRTCNLLVLSETPLPRLGYGSGFDFAILRIATLTASSS